MSDFEVVNISEDNPTHAEQGEENIRARYGLIPDLRKKPTIPVIVPQAPKMIILRCPLCKVRTEIPLAQWLVGIPCATKGCNGKMTYHKDKVTKHV